MTPFAHPSTCIRVQVRQYCNIVVCSFQALLRLQWPHVTPTVDCSALQEEAPRSKQSAGASSSARPAATTAADDTTQLAMNLASAASYHKQIGDICEVDLGVLLHLCTFTVGLFLPGFSKNLRKPRSHQLSIQSWASSAHSASISQGSLKLGTFLGTQFVVRVRTCGHLSGLTSARVGSVLCHLFRSWGGQNNFKESPWAKAWKDQLGRLQKRLGQSTTYLTAMLTGHAFFHNPLLCNLRPFHIRLVA